MASGQWMGLWSWACACECSATESVCATDCVYAAEWQPVPLCWTCSHRPNDDRDRERETGVDLRVGMRSIVVSPLCILAFNPFHSDSIKLSFSAPFFNLIQAHNHHHLHLPHCRLERATPPAAGKQEPRERERRRRSLRRRRRRG